MRVLILGNSGSGKSTLAANLSHHHQLAHLDLDPIAWLDDPPPTRRPLPDSRRLIDQHTTRHPRWVIEGCYADLAVHALQHQPTLILLDPGVETCLQHARQRPWEPHKYDTPEQQQANLAMLLDWITDYPNRTDSTGQPAHLELFHAYPGPKQHLTRLQDLTL